MTERIQSKRSEPARESAPATRIHDKPYPSTLQEDMIAALCHCEVGREVAQRVDPALFEGDYRIIAERAVEYWKQYDQPPGAHTANLLSDILKDPRDGRDGTFRTILIDMLHLSESINKDYVLDQLGIFVRMQKMQGAVLATAQKLQAQREAAIPEVEEMWADLLQSSSGSDKLIARPASAFRVTKTRWLDEHKRFLLRGAINLITGEGGVGKTLIALDYAARLSRRKRKQATIFLTIEDEPGADLRPRFEAAGGDPDLLLFIGTPDGDEFDLVDSFADRKRLDEIEKIVISRGDVSMLVVDPFIDFAGRDVNHYSESDARAALKPLRALARKYALAIIIIVHFNKKQDVSASGRTGGSAAYRNVPRSVLLILPDRDDPGRTLMVQHKYNKIARDSENAIGFVTVTRSGVPTIQWDDELTRVDPDDILQNKAGRPSKQGDVAELLRKALAQGPVAVSELQAMVEDVGISWPTAQKTKKEMPIESLKRGACWYWRLEARAGFGEKRSRARR